MRTAAPSSQAVNALLKLRGFILGGEIKAGERMSELALVERLGGSRTPIRAALVRLEQEGLLRTVPRDLVTARGLLAALRGAPWVLRERRVLPPHAEARFAALEEAQRTSTARKYVS